MKARHAPAVTSEASSTARGLLVLLARVAAWLIIPLYVAGICAFLWLSSLLGAWDENPAEGW